MTSAEFYQWADYLDQEVNDFRTIDHYLAQIACEVRRTALKHPGEVKTEHFLLRFEAQKPSAAMSLEDRTQRSKNYWMGIVGLQRGKRNG